MLGAELARLGDGERGVLAHSLAVALWLYAAALLSGPERVDRVLLISLPSPDVLADHEEVAAFGRVPHDPVAVGAASVGTRLVYSDDDPHCPEGAPVAYAGLNLDADAIHNGGHLDPDSGYGAWPSVLAWCHDPTTRLAGR